MILPTPILRIQEEQSSLQNVRPALDQIIIKGAQSTDIGGHLTDVFFLPDENGRAIGSLTILRSSLNINCRPNGPNEMFTTLQGEDLELQRNPIRQGDGKCLCCFADLFPPVFQPTY